ncbi:ABC transporter ATP-binding protein [Leisingera aquimarina]|uniref:ABC transporter ATP-binding protein n=1 Tax=Leisingera aquimarina TaxID=476529 RepID=UPI0004051B10|nr:ABC transporter ATP-binding protein [Leisingera aquimarina]
MEPYLKVTSIEKTFGAVRALDNVNLLASRGECIAILGENGAGKTTLASVLIGLYQPDSGQIELDGSKISVTSPAAAIEHGIGMIHQHFSLFGAMTAEENILIGLPGEKRGAAARARIRQLCDDFDFTVDFNVPVASMAVGMKQRVEILKALFRDVSILILDEPTSVLAPTEVAPFLQGVRKLVANGCLVFFISHKLDEIREIADRVMIMRHGRVEGILPVATTPMTQMSALMMGQDASGQPAEKTEIKETRLDTVLAPKALVVSDVSLTAPSGAEILKDVDFTLHAGEILGIVGIDGNGQTELSEVITGLKRQTSGRILLGDKEISNSTITERISDGVGFVPEDRHAEGLVLSLSVEENFAFRSVGEDKFMSGRLISRRAISKIAEEAVKVYDIRPSNPKLNASALSGGNQQKIVLAREVARARNLLVVVQPTKGLDVGATQFVQDQIRAVAQSGVGVLYISTELEHVLEISHRVAVMAFGRISGIVDPQNTTLQDIGLLMTASPEEKL